MAQWRSLAHERGREGRNDELERARDQSPMVYA